MDHAVALVETYLRVNGFFTVTEYPVVEASRRGDCRAVTDLDLLAFRFAGADRPERRLHGGENRHHEVELFAPDPELSIPGDEAQMLIGEVKEGRAELNQAATDPAVLEAALTRFGCCLPEHVPAVVRNLLRDGQARTHCGHVVRLVAFGSAPGQSNHGRYKTVLLGHVESFLFEFIRKNWDAVHSAQFKDPAFGFLLMQQKARLGIAATPSKDRAA